MANNGMTPQDAAMLKIFQKQYGTKVYPNQMTPAYALKKIDSIMKKKKSK
jgi:hypothetical protein